MLITWWTSFKTFLLLTQKHKHIYLEYFFVCFCKNRILFCTYFRSPVQDGCLTCLQNSCVIIHSVAVLQFMKSCSMAGCSEPGLDSSCLPLDILCAFLCPAPSLDLPLPLGAWGDSGHVVPLGDGERVLPLSPFCWVTVEWLHASTEGHRPLRTTALFTAYNQACPHLLQAWDGDDSLLLVLGCCTSI